MRSINIAMHTIRIVLDRSIYGIIADYNIEKFSAVQSALIDLSKAMDDLAPEQREAFEKTFLTLVKTI